MLQIAYHSMTSRARCNMYLSAQLFIEIALIELKVVKLFNELKNRVNLVVVYTSSLKDTFILRSN